jgi:uncharacterized protein DUF5666
MTFGPTHAIRRHDEHGRDSRRALRSTRRTEVLPIVLALSILLVPAAIGPRALWGRTGADALARVRVGDWIQLEGTVQADLSVLCSEVKLLTGDFLDDDWSVQGAIRSVDAGKHEFVIAGVRVHVTNNTVYESPRGRLKGFSDLRPGMPVDVEGTYQPSGRFLAAEVDDETDELSLQIPSRQPFEVVARVEQVDVRRRTIVSLGTMFRLTDKTSVRSVIE